MDLLFLAIGTVMGLIIAVPLGPVNIIVIRATLRRGIKAGLAAGAGSVAADTAFAAAAAFGLRQVADLFTRYETAIGLFGGLILVAIGVRTATRHVAADLLAEQPAAPATHELWRRAVTTFSATVINPLSALGVVALFGAMAGMLHLERGNDRAAAVVIGFAIGGALWWLGLSFTIERLRTRLSTRTLDRINRWTGVVIAAFGFGLLLKVAGY